MPNKKEPDPLSASWMLVRWIQRNSKLKKNNLLISLTIANSYYPHNKTSQISVKQIRSKTGLSLSTVTRSLKVIAQSGEWVITPGVPQVNSKKSGKMLRAYNIYSPNIPPEVIVEKEKKHV